MTRRSKREIERAVADLGATEDGEESAHPLMVYEDPESGAWHDGDGTVYEAGEADPVAVFQKPLEQTSETGGIDT